MTRLQYIKPTLILASSLLLAACGGGSDDPPTDPVSLSGSVADGYLSGATVCLDLNKNKQCDSGEPSDVSTAGGAFTIEATQAQIDAYPLLVEINAGTIDEDTNQAVGSTYVMSAPAGSNFVSPLTTMVQTKIDANPTLSVAVAETLVKQDLGYTAQDAVSLFEDYIQAKADSANTDAAEYRSLHNIARVTAAVMAENYQAVTTAAAAANTDLDVLIQIIVESVIAELDTIVNNVETAADDGTFDATDVASVSGNISNTDITTLAQEIEQLQSQNTSPPTSDLLALLQTGLYWFDGDVNDEQFEYGIIAVNSENEVTDIYYEYNVDNGMFELSTWQAPADYDLALTSGGWQSTHSSNNPATASVSVEADGSLLVDGGVDLQSINSALEIDLTGLNIAQNIDDSDFPSENIDPAATFSSGAKGYQLSINTNDVYGIGYWNDGQCQVYSASGTGTNCVNIMINESAAQTLVDTIGHALYLGDDLEYTLEGTANDTSGTVSYRKISTDSALTSGNWSLQTMNGEQLIVFDIPADVQPLTYDEDPLKAFHTVYDGYVRLGWVETGGTFEVLLFNDVARDDIIDSFDPNVGDGTGVTDPASFNGTWSGVDQYGALAHIVFTGDNMPTVYYEKEGACNSWNLVRNENTLTGDGTSTLTLDGDTLTEVNDKNGTIIYTRVNSITGLCSQSLQVPLSGEYFFDGTELGMLVFHPDGFYLQWQDGSTDPNCAETNVNGGIEYGSYSYDGTTFTAIQQKDENASCGLTDMSSATLEILANGNLSFNNGNEQAIGPRMDGGSGSIVGAWTGAGTVTSADMWGAFVFFPNGNYMTWHEPNTNNDCPNGGIEYGSYSLNTDSNTLSGNVVVDENGYCGINNGTGDFSLSTVTVTGDTFTVSDGEGSVSFTRL